MKRFYRAWEHVVFVVMLLFVLSLVGCDRDRVDLQDDAISACKRKCEDKLYARFNFSNGPCLSEEIVDDWACDLVSRPRRPWDDELNNTCLSYREGEVRHLVEVDTSCEYVSAR